MPNTCTIRKHIHKYKTPAQTENAYANTKHLQKNKTLQSIITKGGKTEPPRGEYQTKTEDLRPKNEDPVKIVLKSLEKGSNMIFDWNRNKEQQDLRLSTKLTRVFVFYINLPKVQRPLQNMYPCVTCMYPYVTRMLVVCYSYVFYVPVTVRLFSYVYVAVDGNI